MDKLKRSSILALLTFIGSLHLHAQSWLANGNLYTSSSNTKVGIGTSSPETGIHIRNSQFLNAMITIERTSNGYGGAYRFVTKHSSGLPNGRAIGNLLWYGSISPASISGAAAKIGVTTTQSWNTSMNGTRLDFWVTPNGSNSLNSSPSMIINQDGSIGVGTVNPTEKVDINGTARLRGLTENNSFSRILAAEIGRAHV